MKMIPLYDAKCSLCQETKKWFEKLDWLNKVQWTSLQEYENPGGEKQFKSADLRKEMHLLLPSGRVLKGFYAVRKLMIHFPLTFLPGMILYFPFMDRIGVPAYRWTAKNRYRFLRKNCKDGSCSI
ncbi:thiol-disulfide oxidoreductase DCC family protein [Neobacillus terrae]|uniref:thiol-disulfide oxidoreductase DCC family protein n=1 Tax=Neobacillus terrae TaxID=3034837 RepID=UPI001408BEED|nr:DUF393 domain-containing protein [Neobacillus terrae]NHM33127.1 DUF393 domain-containing protein [Neobacillus terrae]